MVYSNFEGIIWRSEVFCDQGRDIKDAADSDGDGCRLEIFRVAVPKHVLILDVHEEFATRRTLHCLMQMYIDRANWM